jgi:hypothetical protein
MWRLSTLAILYWVLSMNFISNGQLQSKPHGIGAEAFTLLIWVINQMRS